MALNKPEGFAAAIRISGVLDIVTVMKNPIHPLFNVDKYFGGFDKLKDSYNDLFAQVQNLKQWSSTLPRLYIACGLEDNLYEMNTKFRDLAIANSILLTYDEGPGGHTWEFGDQYIFRALEWLARSAES